MSNINVTKYNEYKEFDEKGLNAIKIAAPNKPVGSVETTHGIIRLHAENKPFLFIYSKVDRVGYFDTEVDPKDNAQNFSVAFNGGIFIGWLIPQLSNILQYASPSIKIFKRCLQKICFPITISINGQSRMIFL